MLKQELFPKKYVKQLSQKIHKNDLPKKNYCLHIIFHPKKGVFAAHWAICIEPYYHTAEKTNNNHAFSQQRKSFK